VKVPRTVTHVRIPCLAKCNCTNLRYCYLWCRENQPGMIPNRAFTECTALVDVVLHDGIHTIGDWAFNGCKSLLHIILPASVTSIHHCAFAGCTGLLRIIIPPSVTYMGERVFELCRKDWKQSILWLQLIALYHCRVVEEIGNYDIKNC
jgi:hypothetical protein